VKKELKDKHFVKKPVYHGGVKAMQAFLAKHKRYPKEALEGRVEGTVSIRYSIDYLGKVTRTKVLAGIGFGCDEEAQRIVSLLTFSVPKTRKMRVNYQKTAHIHFKLPKEPVQQRFVYVTKKESDSSGKAGTSYNYQVNW